MAEVDSEQTLELEQESGSEKAETLPPSFIGQEPDPGSEDNKENEQENSQISPRTESSRASFKTLLFDILETLFLTIVIYAVLSTFVGRYKVLSVSMEPTLQEGQYLLISKQTHKIWSLKRGDVIVFHYPRNPKKNYIKRIIGLPGEEIKFQGDKLYVDGELVPEPWLSKPMRETSGEWELGEDEYFVMGDNRNNSSDSRAWGYVNSRLIIGKALFCYWPVECWSVIQHGPQPTSATRHGFGESPDHFPAAAIQRGPDPNLRNVHTSSLVGKYYDNITENIHGHVPVLSYRTPVWDA